MTLQSNDPEDMQESVRSAMQAFIPNVESAEFFVEWSGETGAGRADAVYSLNSGERVVANLHRVDNEAFERVIGADSPDEEHLENAIRGARALGAQRVHLIYVLDVQGDERSGAWDWLGVSPIE